MTSQTADTLRQRRFDVQHRKKKVIEAIVIVNMRYHRIYKELQAFT
jgi:hypothetical protein